MWQLRMPFTNDLGNATTMSDTNGGGINITMNMTTNGVVAADLIGAPGTGVTNLNINARALDLTTNNLISYASGNVNPEPVVNLVNSAALATLGNSGVIGNFTLTFWMNEKVTYAGSGSSPRLFVLNAGSTPQADAGSANNLAMVLDSSSQLDFYYGTANNFLTGTPASTSANQWIFVAVTYDGTTFNMYSGTPTSSATLINSKTSAARVSIWGQRRVCPSATAAAITIAPLTAGWKTSGFTTARAIPVLWKACGNRLCFRLRRRA